MARRSKNDFPNVFVDESTIHGFGLFAGERVEPGCRIIDYKGERIPSGEGTTRSRDSEELTYIFTLSDKYDIDGSVNGNDARFANHSCDGNTYVDIIRNRIWLIAQRGIAKGEEITFDYRLQAEDLHECVCGADLCFNDTADTENEVMKKAVRRGFRSYLDGPPVR